MNLTLVRDAALPYATLGTLGGLPQVLQTLELPWVQDPSGAPCGAPGRSCVPVGEYQLALHDTPAHPKTFALVNPDLGVYHEPGDVPAGTGACRVAILIHVANYASELEGCVGVGTARYKTPSQWMITQSAHAFTLLTQAVPWEVGHTLTITESFP